MEIERELDRLGTAYVSRQLCRGGWTDKNRLNLVTHHYLHHAVNGFTHSGHTTIVLYINTFTLKLHDH